MKTTPKSKAGIKFASLPKDYDGLVRFHTPRPIHDQIECDNAAEIVLAMCSQKLTQAQEDYLHLLSLLIEEYQDQHDPPEPPLSGLEMLRHLLDENNLKAADLARLLGIHRTHGAMILRGERKLTLGHVKVLMERFGLPAEVFLA